MQKEILIILCIISTLYGCGMKESRSFNDKGITINTITEEGAWCWFADPRALHYQNEQGSINSTYIGYIDVHGSIKATQIDHLKKSRTEVLVRSRFQPDDHNNPTFLVLPDERIMIFYSRHTDESCFYYRISREPGDITTLGKEMQLQTDHNTTYPSPFILSDDPEHIYLCWRGIGWHPTIARLTLPDEQDQVAFNWGPHQIVRSMKGAPGVRPYAKYATNGKDRIYLAYTTTHPDNLSKNWIYLNSIDIHSFNLSDITGNHLSSIGSSPLHEVDITPQYREQHPYAVVDSTHARNWIWELVLDKDEHPVIAMVSIDSSKSSHDYYHVKWTDNQWKKTFLSNAGGHFHQSPDIEKCYSGGMTINKNDPQVIYGSVPVEGKHGDVYELVKFTVAEDGSERSAEQITFDSPANNIRPYSIAGLKGAASLAWMQGDYYDWIVSKERPEGFPTAIRTTVSLPEDSTGLEKGLLYEYYHEATTQMEDSIRVAATETFTLVLDLSFPSDSTGGEIIQFAGLTYVIPYEEMSMPYLTDGISNFKSSNLLARSDNWKNQERATNGKWYAVEKLRKFRLVITYEEGTLRTYIDGLLDQSFPLEGIKLREVTTGESKGVIEKLSVFNRRLLQDEIKMLR